MPIRNLGTNVVRKKGRARLQPNCAPPLTLTTALGTYVGAIILRVCVRA